MSNLLHLLEQDRRREAAIAQERSLPAATRNERTIIREPMPWRLWVEGVPIPQARPRATAIYSREAGRWIGRIHPYENRDNPARCPVRWRNRIERVIKSGPHPYGLDEPLELTMFFAFERPTSHLRKDGTVSPRYRDVEPGSDCGDWDNLGKLVCDAMGAVGVFRNDTRICRAKPEKVWGERAGCLAILDVLRERRRLVMNDGKPEIVGQEGLW